MESKRGLGTSYEQEERSADHGGGIAEGDRVDTAFGIGHGPLEEGKLCRHPGTGLNVTPPLASEPFASHVQERYTEIDEVDGVKLRDGESACP